MHWVLTMLTTIITFLLVPSPFGELLFDLSLFLFLPCCKLDFLVNNGAFSLALRFRSISIGIEPSKSNFLRHCRGNNHSRSPTILTSKNFDALNPIGNISNVLLSPSIAPAICHVDKSGSLNIFLFIQSFRIQSFWISKARWGKTVIHTASKAVARCWIEIAALLPSLFVLASWSAASKEVRLSP